MDLSRLPQPIATFLQATNAGDNDRLFRVLTEDAVIYDMGTEHRGEQIRKWNDELYIGAAVRIVPLHFEQQEAVPVLHVCVDGDYQSHGVTGPFQLAWFFELKGGKVASLRMTETKLTVPKPVSQYVMAMNMHDGEAMMGAFLEEAVVNDQQREHLGKRAIRAWADKELIADNVTMYVAGSHSNGDHCAVLAKVTGTYDKTGLPDPLMLRFYFSASDQGISQLVIVPVKRDNA
jgi:hypothetical protein